MNAGHPTITIDLEDEDVVKTMIKFVVTQKVKSYRNTVWNEVLRYKKRENNVAVVTNERSMGTRLRPLTKMNTCMKTHCSVIFG